MDKCAAGAFEKLIKKQTAGGGKTRILPLRGKSGSYGKKNAAQALQYLGRGLRSRYRGLSNYGSAAA